MLKYFERLTDPFPAPDFIPPPKHLIRFLRHYSKGMGRMLLCMSAASATLAILEVALFGFLGNLVDWLSDQNPETLFTDHRTTLICMGILVLGVMPLLIWLRATIVHQALLGNYAMAIRWRAHNYLLKQSMSFFQDDFSGRISTKIMQTALAIRETVMKLMDVILYVSVYFVSLVVLVAQADVRFAILMLAWLMSYVAIQCYFVPRLKAISREQADARSLMTGRIVDSYTNIRTIKLFAHTSAENQYTKDSMDQFLQTVYRQMRLVTCLTGSIQTINYVLLFLVAGLSLFLWQASEVSLGAITVAISLALRINGMSQWIMWEISSIFENLGVVMDGADTLTRPHTLLDAPDAKPLEISQSKIEFRQVNFAYHAQNPIFENLELRVQSGEKIGLVGRSGAGKSTLVNLLLRFYDVNSGEIRIDDQPIKTLEQESLRQQIGMVTQDTALLHRSIRENILYGRPGASEESMIEAAKQAQAHEFITTLRDPQGRIGYDAHVGEQGVKLSGGQRQRIAIARVLLKDAPILVLDEATSALDSEVESAIQSSLYRLMEGKTVLAIAHRLSTIAALDRLIVIDQGRVVESGTHQALLSQGGIYAKLWNQQTGGFLGLS